MAFPFFFKTKKEYLSSDLNLHRMYHVFKIKNAEHKISYRFYQRVFKKHLKNISFSKPRVDTCSLCDRLNAKIKLLSSCSEQLNIIQDLTLHHCKSQKALGLLNKSVNESQLPQSTTCSVSMDLHQMLFCPTNMFYSRQLSNYNFCIHLGYTSNSYMCMWHEAIASRGGSEIASCL